MTAMQMPVLKASSRAAGGKAAARRVRREGLVPAVAYGKGLPSTSIAVPPKEVASILEEQARAEHRPSRLEMEKGKILAMISEFALHPIDRHLQASKPSR